ncbi:MULTISPECIES: ABC transporter substrate-binding protein [Ramlibacter]|uniref:Extracellular solute-binding protein n=1 Tax=Ramlibacter pinisoli TaxID=2682844 RepID=A0A6N8INQ1_9BURK|nr:MULTISPECIES: ABC transporter substrate-binding protein [Ramlibacter]MVQ28487.1 extracellular solute-binding protein [Ramlibacter pinisoli]
MQTFRIARCLVALLGAGAVFAAGAQQRTLTVITGGGLQGESNVKAFVEPFEKETGIKVIAVKDQATLSSFKLKVQSGNVDFDLAAMTPPNIGILARDNLLEAIDYKQFDSALMDKLPRESKTPWGVQSFSFAWVLGFSEASFPVGKPAPESWADFWDVKKFPGTRTLEGGTLGSEGPLEEALLADGVPVDKLYPLDIDRAFRSLDKIKPHIRKWWKVGSEQMQLFQSGGANIGMGYDGRFTALTQAGKPMRISWNQAKMSGIYWVIPKGAKNVKEAHKFIEFASRPDRQAAFATLTGYGPSNPAAFDMISKELAATMVSSPENRKRAYMVNFDWYGQVGADGKTNSERIAERWNAWITQ